MAKCKFCGCKMYEFEMNVVDWIVSDLKCQRRKELYCKCCNMLYKHVDYKENIN